MHLQKDTPFFISQARRYENFLGDFTPPLPRENRNVHVAPKVLEWGPDPVIQNVTNESRRMGNNAFGFVENALL
jgi:hypothetical protein